MYKYVVFDLDGTLINTQKGTIKTFRAGLNHFGIDDTDENIKALIGPPFARTVITHYGLSEEEGKKAIEVCNEYIIKKGVYECEVFSGIKEVLKTLKENNIKLAVATSQGDESAIEEAKYTGIFEYFDLFVANDMFQRSGTKSDFIAVCLEEMGVTNKEEAIMIGDKSPDIHGGKENGLDTIGVLYGYGSEEEINESNPSYIASSPKDLIDIILG